MSPFTTAMNVHPILVHFPIALLTVYAALELLRIPWLTKRPALFHVKAALAVIGAASAVAAYLSGDAIENIFSGDPAANRLVHVHSHWAIATILVFGVLAACYAFAWLEAEIMIPARWARAHAAAKSVRGAVLDTPVAPVLALIGLACVTVTGALGGAIVYGPDIDPFVKFIASVVA